jgi:hypothetical protein
MLTEMTQTLLQSEWSHFTGTNILFTGVGSLIFWSRNGRKKLKVLALGGLFDDLKISEDNRYRIVTELVLFVTFGILIGIAFVCPTTMRQALSAGIAWTGMVSRRAE